MALMLLLPQQVGGGGGMILSVAAPVLRSLNIFQVLAAKVILQLRLGKQCCVGICCNKAIRICIFDST